MHLKNRYCLIILPNLLNLCMYVCYTAGLCYIFLLWKFHLLKSPILVLRIYTSRMIGDETIIRLLTKWDLFSGISSKMSYWLNSKKKRESNCIRYFCQLSLGWKSWVLLTIQNGKSIEQIPLFADSYSLRWLRELCVCIGK